MSGATIALRAEEYLKLVDESQCLREELASVTVRWIADLAAANAAKERAERQRDAMLAKAKEELALWQKRYQWWESLATFEVLDILNEIIAAADPDAIAEGE